MSESKGLDFDRVAKFVSMAGMVVLCFLTGSFVTEFHLFPYPQLLENAYQAARAKKVQFAKHGEFNPKKALQWRTVPDKAKQPGTVVHKEDKVQSGYTLWSVGGLSAAWLSNFQGGVLHEWYIPWRKAYGANHPHVDNPAPSHSIKMAGVHVYPNGDLLATYSAGGDTPYGYGLIRADKNSNVIWAYPDNVHHDVDLLQDGRLWTLTQSMQKLSGEEKKHYRKGTDRILEDYAVLLSPDGTKIRKFSIATAIEESKWSDELLKKWIRGKKWDPLHTNNIEVIHEDFARHHDFAEPGQLLISLRPSSALALIDPTTERLVWASKGFWAAQHDPDPYPNGHIMLYDNRGHSGPGGGSRMVEFVPGTNEIVWSYTGTPENPFFTKWGGKASTLENKNVLFNEPLGTRMVEVTREKEIAWEFHNPLRIDWKGKTYTTNINGFHERINPKRLNFELQGPIGPKPIFETYRQSD